MIEQIDPAADDKAAVELVLLFIKLVLVMILAHILCDLVDLVFHSSLKGRITMRADQQPDRFCVSFIDIYDRSDRGKVRFLKLFGFIAQLVERFSDLVDHIASDSNFIHGIVNVDVGDLFKDIASNNNYMHGIITITGNTVNINFGQVIGDIAAGGANSEAAQQAFAEILKAFGMTAADIQKQAGGINEDLNRIEQEA